MVALQFLVLPVKVRIFVRQQNGSVEVQQWISTDFFLLMPMAIFTSRYLLRDICLRRYLLRDSNFAIFAFGDSDFVSFCLCVPKNIFQTSHVTTLSLTIVPMWFNFLFAIQSNLPKGKLCALWYLKFRFNYQLSILYCVPCIRKDSFVTPILLFLSD